MAEAPRYSVPRPGPGNPKIFGIGLSRTGTTSLTTALEILGFPAVHYPTEYGQIDAKAGATDITVLMMLEALDRRYPGSRFILTTRALEPWLQSCQRHWEKNAAFFKRSQLVMDVERQIYGEAGFDRQRYTEVRARHLLDIDAYFKDRRDTLLTLDIFLSPAPWAALCNFLGAAVPDVPFPADNSSKAVDQILHRFLDHFEDCAELARITTISEAYIRKLQCDPARGSISPSPQLGTGFEQTRIMKWASEALGADEVARILGLAPERVVDYLRRL